MKRTKPVLTILTVGVTVAAVLTASSAVAQSAPRAAAGSAVAAERGHKHPSYTPPPIVWRTCKSASLQAAGARCGMLTVPLDYAKPRGRKIKLALSRVLHKTPDAAAQGIMLVNPGGPGGSGLTLSRLGSYVPNGGGDPYDWIGFDPRGVGSSRPSLTCNGRYFPYARPDYAPSTKRLQKFWLRKSAGYAAACKRRGGKLLDHLKTTDTVNDIESIRKALHQRQINYYGFSYGTTIGQVYATLHPTRVRRMVLDGVVDPSQDPYVSNLGQDVAFETTEDAFFAWVAKYHAVYGLGDTQQQVKALWTEMLARSRQAPFAGKIGPDEWTDAFLSAGYYVFGWEDTARAFTSAVAGDYAPIIGQYDAANGSGSGSDNGFAIYLGTQCTDAPWPHREKRILRDNRATYTVAPFETWANAQYNGPCLRWKGRAAKKPFKIHGAGVAPVLMVAETYDAATPFSGALEARRRFPSSVLIEGVGGTTHAGSLSGVSCTDDRIAAYLLTGALDPRQPGNQSDVKCDPVPAPDPTAPASMRRSTAESERLPADLRAVITSAAG